MNVSNNKYDISQWILRIIKSCKTFKQLKGCDKLSRNFYKMYKDADLRFRIEMAIFNKHDNLIDKM